MKKKAIDIRKAPGVWKKGFQGRPRMTIAVSEVQNRWDLKQWITFPLDLYRNDPNYIPQLTRDELDFFSPGKNPAFKVADAKLLLARRDGKAAGRVCGIIHRLESQKLGYRRGRFGWFESVEDPAAAGALLGQLERWFVAEGCREMTGPHGFTDLDPEGMLVEGFEALPTIAGGYNKPYYPKFMEGFGFEKEVDYIEQRVQVPQEMPALFKMMEKKALPAAAAEGYKLVKDLTRKQLLQYAGQFWEALEASFAHLYGVTPLSDEQKRYYEKKYFNYIDPTFIQLVVDARERLQGFFLALPSLSRAFQKARGRLLPWGFLHILKGFKQFDTVDFYFAGVHPESNPQRVLPLMTLGIYRAVRQKGVHYVETNRELETNTAIVGLWSRFGVVNKRRTRIFRKNLLSLDS
jgi:hypothetical protein